MEPLKSRTIFVSGIENESPLRTLNNKVIVWGYPHPFSEALNSNSVDWIKLGLGVERNPVSIMKPAGLRVAAEFAHVRPFYSRIHNVALLLFLPAIYASAAYGFVGCETNLLLSHIGYRHIFCGLGRKISPVHLPADSSPVQLGSSHVVPTAHS